MTSKVVLVAIDLTGYPTRDVGEPPRPWQGRARIRDGKRVITCRADGVSPAAVTRALLRECWRLWLLARFPPRREATIRRFRSRRSVSTTVRRKP